MVCWWNAPRVKGCYRKDKSLMGCVKTCEKDLWIMLCE